MRRELLRRDGPSVRRSPRGKGLSAGRCYPERDRNSSPDGLLESMQAALLVQATQKEKKNIRMASARNAKPMG